MSKLTEKRCEGCEGGVSPLSTEAMKEHLQELQGWTLDEQSKLICKMVYFKNYYHTMAFVNAVAFMAHDENHHPDLIVSYNKCTVQYTTHAIGGLSLNDFICAAKVDALIAQSKGH